MSILPDYAEKYIAALGKRLKDPLPGKNVHLEMAPQGRSLSPPVNTSPPRRSAVLLPLISNEQQRPSLLFTVRHVDLNHHGGEISFPGGAVEDEDTSSADTALREAYEEIHLLPRDVEVLGELTPLYIPPSHYLVHPIIGWISGSPSLCPNDNEVEQILNISLDRLLDPATVLREQWTRDDQTICVPFYKVSDRIIWGATAMIVREFLVLTEQIMEGCC